MTWGELWRTIYGYWIRQEREWDRTRTIVAVLYNVNRGKKRAAKRPNKVMPLAIDRMRLSELEWTQELYDEFERALEAWGLKKEDGTEERHNQD